MTNHKLHFAANAHRPSSRSATPIVMAASIVVGISGACLVPFNPALARMPDSMASVTPGLVTDGGGLRSSASLPLVSSLATSDMQVQRNIPNEPFRAFFRRILRFFFGFIPGDPI
jgi:hypothetical protein